MEDYIKFIPIALYVIYKLVGGSKKKEQKPQKTRKAGKSTSAPTTSLEDILRELTGQEPAAAKPEPTPSRARHKKIEMVDHQHDFRPEYEHHADTELDLAEVRADIRKSQGLGRIEVEEEYDDVDFDLRAAIIAETVLNRPQYD